MDRRLAPLAFGSFVVATDGTLIVGLLRRVAADLSASPAAIGQSIAVFAFAYAAGAPLLIVRTRGWRQEHVLLSALILFAAANLATALAGSLATLLAARVVAGAAAGAFTPTAAALAAVSVERRGRALAFVVGGASAAAIVGVPLGTIVGVYLGWRAAFFLVAAMSLALIAALLKGPKESGRLPQPGSSRPLPRRRLLMTLLVTLLWATGSFTFFTYLAVVLHKTAGVSGLGVALYLLLFGIAGTIGVTVAGRAVDARGGAAILTLALLFVAASLSGLALTAALTPPHRVAVVVTAAMVILYGLGTWAVTPPQQDRLLRNGNSGRVVLSLNASALYGGVAIGGALGGIILTASHSIPALCIVAAAVEIGAVLIAWPSTTELSHRNAEVDRIPRTAVKRPHQPQRLNVCG